MGLVGIILVLIATANRFVTAEEEPEEGMQVKTISKNGLLVAKDDLLLLHPSLTSTSYLETKPTKRHAQHTDFHELKSNLLLLAENDPEESASVTDNEAVETRSPPPYSRLPESYQSLLPTSYYATHTFVPPIKNLYPVQFRNRVKTAPSLDESSRTSGQGNLTLSTDDDDTNANEYLGEIITLEELSPEKIEDDSLSKADPFEGAEAEFENDFKPSNLAPLYQLPVASPYTSFFQQQPSRNVDESSFGVAVTPITVDKYGHKTRDAVNEIPSSSPSYVYKAQKAPEKLKTPSLGKSPHATYTTTPTPRYKRKNPSKVHKYYVKPEQVSSYLDQLAQEGYDRQVFFDELQPPTFSDSPSKNALLFLGPSGPSMPAFSKLSNELTDMMTGLVRGPVREMATSFHSHDNTPIMTRVGTAMNKMLGGHIGDRSFDAFDFIPLIAIIVATGLILSGIFPSGATTLGLTNGNLVLGRREDRAEEESMLDNALGRLETGVLMVSALRYEDGCSKRLACRLGKMAKESSSFFSGQTGEAIFGAVNAVLPEEFTSFARSFRDVVSEEDETSCQEECYRCIAI